MKTIAITIEEDILKSIDEIAQRPCVADLMLKGSLQSRLERYNKEQYENYCDYY